MKPALRAVAGGALLALLAVHGATYAVRGEALAALDSAGWLILLLLFDAEARRPAVPPAAWLRTARALATVAVVTASGAYWHAGDALDAVNSLLWFAVIALWEARLRWPRQVTRAGFAFRTLLVAVYAGLVAMPCAWLAAGAWFEAWDAAAWLAAFALIERDVARQAS